MAGKQYEASIGVGDGSGDLFVHGSHEAVKRVQGFILELEDLRRTKAYDQERLVDGRQRREDLERRLKDAEKELVHLRAENVRLTADFSRAMGYVDRVLESDDPEGKSAGPRVGMQTSAHNFDSLLHR